MKQEKRRKREKREMKGLQSGLIVIMSTLLLSFVTGACAAGQVQAVKFQGERNIKIMMGSIENRDIRYSPYTVSNFSDLLSYQLREVGYEVDEMREVLAEEYDEKLKKAAEAKAPEVEKTPEIEMKKAKTGDSTRNLLPAHLRHVAGEQKPRVIKERDENPRLSPREIRDLQKRRPFKYFVQGSISQSDSDPLLEIERNVLVLITVYDSKGHRVGALSYTAEGEELNGSEFMKVVCARLTGAFDENIRR